MWTRYPLLLLVAFSGATAWARDTAQFDEGGTFDFPLYANPGAEQQKYDRAGSCRVTAGSVGITPRTAADASKNQQGLE